MRRQHSAWLCALRLAAIFAAFPAASVALSDEPARFLRPGPYPVGVRTLVLVDASRDDVLTGRPRTLVTDVWYPAAEEGRGRSPKRFVEFFGDAPEAAQAFVEHFGGRLEEVNRRFRCVAVSDLPVRPGTYPLLIFSHGNGGLRHQSVFQLDHLASHGYIIASADHTGNAGVAVLPGRVVPYDREGRGRAAAERTADIRFLIDRLLALHEEEGSWLRGAVEVDSIGVLGHSFGGFNSCQVGAEDRRVKAILPMTLAFGRAPRVPTMVMLAGLDRTVRDAGNFASRAYWVSCPPPRYLLVLKRAGHYSFSDMDLINPSFGDGVGKETRDGKTTTFLEAKRAKEIICAYGLAFFERHLRACEDAEEFLRGNVDPEEIEYIYVPSAGESSAEEASLRPTRILIVTGMDVPAHDWRATTAIDRRNLEATGRFEVFVTEDAELLGTSALERYDVVVINYRSPPSEPLSDEARENLRAFVSGGKGLVAIHFAVYAWSEWAEYASIIGRVWIGRQGGAGRRATEAAEGAPGGPGGKVSGHGPKGPFRVRIASRGSPILRGLDDFEVEDELYSRLVGDAPIEVLATAYSDWSQEDEPVAWTLRYGEGRVFVTVLGHDAAVREDPDYRNLLLRGAAWAAGRAESQTGASSVSAD